MKGFELDCGLCRWVVPGFGTGYDYTQPVKHLTEGTKRLFKQKVTRGFEGVLDGIAGRVVRLFLALGSYTLLW